MGYTVSKDDNRIICPNCKGMKRYMIIIMGQMIFM